MEYNTGTTKIVSTAIDMPPTIGIAMGTMISDPLPVEDKTGINAIIVVAVVIMAGRTLNSPASTTVCLISSTVLGNFSLNKFSRVDNKTTALSVATPLHQSKARRPLRSLGDHDATRLFPGSRSSHHVEH